MKLITVESKTVKRKVSTNVTATPMDKSLLRVTPVKRK